MMRLIILATGLLGCLYSQTYLFQASETLTYTTGFHLFSAETSTLQILEQEGEGTLHVVLRIRTSNFLDHFYRVRDRVDLWLDPRTLELRRMSLRRPVSRSLTRDFQIRSKQ